MKNLALRLAISLLTFIISFAATKLVAEPFVRQANREGILKQDLRDMRVAIDQYAMDQDRLPQSLEELVKNGYILKIPTDVFTERSDWRVDIEEDPFSRTGQSGITDVHSNSPGKDRSQIPYSEY